MNVKSKETIEETTHSSFEQERFKEPPTQTPFNNMRRESSLT